MKKLFPYPKDEQRFSKEQLRFVVEVMITSAIEVIDHVISTDPDIEDLISSRESVAETLGFNLSILYAQITGDGMGCSDVLQETGLFDIIKDFSIRKIKEEDIDVSSIAKKFVEDNFAFIDEQCDHCFYKSQFAFSGGETHCSMSQDRVEGCKKRQLYENHGLGRYTLLNPIYPLTREKQ